LEINYVADSSASNDWDLGLRELSELITANPQLQAVSIEMIDMQGHGCVDQLTDFLDFLEDHSEISCVYLETKSSVTPEQSQPWLDVWARLLNRSTFHDNIHTLNIHQAIDRSRRGLGRGRGRPWPVREGKNKKRDNTFCGSRWEHDPWIQHSKRYQSPPSRLAVLERQDACKLIMPNYDTVEEWCCILGKFPAVQHFRVDELEKRFDSVVPALPQLFPELVSMSLPQYHGSHWALDQALAHLPGLISLRLDMVSDRFRLTSTFSQRFEALVVLNTKELYLEEFWCIVGLCPQLQDLQVRIIYAYGTDDMVTSSPEWACKGLRRLSFKLHRYCSAYNSLGNKFLLQTKHLVQQLVLSSSSFMTQLGSLSGLEALTIGFQERDRPLVDSVFFELSLDPLRGLPQLLGLGELRSVLISGLAHSVGRKEIEWMRMYWPRLTSLGLPLLREPPYTKDELHEWKLFKAVPIQEYQKWFPGLDVVAPKDCHIRSADGEWVPVERYNYSNT